jgi:hypothetical protein
MDVELARSLIPKVTPETLTAMASATRSMPLTSLGRARWRDVCTRHHDILLLDSRSRRVKKLALLLCALFVVAGVASAEQATAPAKPAAAPAAKAHVVEAEVVSLDAVAKTLTAKTDQGAATCWTIRH